MIFGAVLAGGTGQRMGSAIPKQFMDLAGRPVIIRTLEKFLACKKLDALYLGVPGDWLEYTRDLIIQYLPGRADEWNLVCGGADRNETLFNVISRIEADHGESSEHIIITHDAVRPFVTLRMIEENIEKAEEYGAVDTVIPSVDTIVISEDGKLIDRIPERRLMYRSQTPQSFKITLLKELYGSLTDDEKGILTDACKICVLKGQPVVAAEGSGRNIKITTAEDLDIALAIALKEDREQDAG